MKGERNADGQAYAAVIRGGASARTRMQRKRGRFRCRQRRCAAMPALIFRWCAPWWHVAAFDLRRAATRRCAQLDIFADFPSDMSREPPQRSDARAILPSTWRLCGGADTRCVRGVVSERMRHRASLMPIFLQRAPARTRGAQLRTRCAGRRADIDVCHEAKMRSAGARARRVCCARCLSFDGVSRDTQMAAYAQRAARSDIATDLRDAAWCYRCGSCRGIGWVVVTRASRVSAGTGKLVMLTDMRARRYFTLLIRALIFSRALRSSAR